jgi:DNA-binding NtrC family response regulator
MIGRILVVEDDPNVRRAFADLLREEGHTVEIAADAFKALPRLADFQPDVVLCDLRLPGMDGLEIIRRARAEDEAAAVVVMTADTSATSAVEAMRLGAADYLCKPVQPKQLLAAIAREIDKRQLRSAARVRRPVEGGIIDRIIGMASPAMGGMRELILAVAPSRASVLITGESGTGKELIASAIHDSSLRKHKPFVKVNCAALSETLLESELFGHERGSFTGAQARRVGRFEQADGGTLFFDEIGDISPAVQVKLLRVLQEREFERVGGNEPVRVDVRIVVATHRDLEREVREGRFREDLYYRLNVVRISTPSLRAMRDNIPTLAMHFLQAFAHENAKTVTGFTDAALRALCDHAWPGNVRQLENTIERAIVMCRGELVDEADLALCATEARGLLPPQIPGATLSEIERYAILKTLEQTGGSTSKTAALLGISARKVQYRLQEYTSPPHGELPSPPVQGRLL